MSWARIERFSLGGSILFMVASAVIGFRWVDSPYFRGYASTAGVFFALSRFAANVRPAPQLASAEPAAPARKEIRKPK
jgi:hypothetical protein